MKRAATTAATTAAIDRYRAGRVSAFTLPALLVPRHPLDPGSSTGASTRAPTAR